MGFARHGSKVKVKVTVMAPESRDPGLSSPLRRFPCRPHPWRMSATDPFTSPPSSVLFVHLSIFYLPSVCLSIIYVSVCLSSMFLSVCLSIIHLNIFLIHHGWHPTGPFVCHARSRVSSGEVPITGMAGPQLGPFVVFEEPHVIPAVASPALWMWPAFVTLSAAVPSVVMGISLSL